jgi:hypothetical protein
MYHGTREMTNLCNILTGKPKGKRPSARPTLRWEDNIKIDLGEIRCEDVKWIQVTQDMVQSRASVDTLMNLQVP